MPRIAERLTDQNAISSQPQGVPPWLTITATRADDDPPGTLARCWRVDIAAGMVRRAEPGPPAAGSGADREWSVAGDSRTWSAALTGQLGLAAAMRRGRLRVSAAEANRSLPLPLYYDPQLAFLTWLLRSRPWAAAPAAGPSPSAIGPVRPTPRKDPL